MKERRPRPQVPHVRLPCSYYSWAGSKSKPKCTGRDENRRLATDAGYDPLVSAAKSVKPRPPEPWEILGAIIAYFAVAKDVPAVLRSLLGWGEKEGWSDTALLWCFTVPFLFASLWLLWRSYADEALEANTDDLPTKKGLGLNDVQRMKLVRVVRSLGFVWWRERKLDKMGIALYGTFERPETWEPMPGRTPYIDRLMYADGRGIEYQYSRGHDVVYVREHEPRSDSQPAPYGPEASRRPTPDDRRLLLVASNHFPWWYVRYLLSRNKP